MNIKRLFEKTSTGFKEFVAKVDFANVIGLGEELAKYIKKDSDNEANVNYVNSTRDKTLTVGYDGINYTNYAPNNTTLKTHIYDNIATFHYSNRNSKASIISTVTYDSFQIRQTAPGHTSSTTYRAKNIARDNFTYTFPDKSGTIELVDEDKDNKLKQITHSDSLSIGYQYSTSFSSLEELANYVNNNSTTEQYMSYINNEGIGSVLLAKNGDINCSFMSDTIGFTVIKGTLDFDNKEVINYKTVGFDTNGAILPNDIKILDDIDHNKAYELNIAKCLELGILTELNISSINSKAKKINF